MSVNSELVRYGIEDTNRSRPPSALTDNVDVQAAEACSTAAQMKLYVSTQSCCMGRHPVLWHVQKTLEDNQFWKLEMVEKSPTSTSLGYSSANGKRMIEWKSGLGLDLVKVTDCTASGVTTPYCAYRSRVLAYLEIRPPGVESVFTKALVGNKAFTDRNHFRLTADWTLPADPLGRDLADAVWATIDQLPATTTNRFSVASWFEAP